MSEEKDTVENIVEGLRGEFQQIMDEILKDAAEDYADFGEAMATEFTSYLWLAYRGDKVAEQNLKHLKAQASLLAVKYRLALSKSVMTCLAEALSIAARIGLAAIVGAIK